MRKMASASSDKSSILIVCSFEWSPTQFILQCDQLFDNGSIFCFNYLLLLERTFGWALVPPHVCFFFGLHLEWSLTLSADKKSNAICIFANLCFFLFSLWFKFSSAWFYFLSKCTKKWAKANREKFKCRWTVLQCCNPHFLMLLCSI